MNILKFLGDLFIVSLICVSVRGCIGSAHADTLTPEQQHWVIQAYDEGALYGLGLYTAAIVLTESSGCMARVGDDGKSLGCGQLRQATARTICRCRISRRTLERNNAVNIRISAQALADCFKRFYPSQRRAVACYNSGAPKAGQMTAQQVWDSAYVKRVNRWLRYLKTIKVSTD
jgi:hypothetical protein